MIREQCKVLENKKAAPGHYVMRLASARIGAAARPGQFVQMVCSNSYEPLLPRPFSFLTSTPKDFSILYHVVGKGTALLAQARRGDLFWVLGPLGNGFTVPRLSSIAPRHIVLVGGGVGIPPLYHLAQSFSNRANVHVFLGARSINLLLCEKDFKKLKVNLYLSTDDGSKGQKGLVTKTLEGFLKSQDHKSVKLFTCGPTPMLKAVSALALKFKMDCEVSVEEPMACGFGVCLGCAVKIRSKVEGGRSKKSDHPSTFHLPPSTCDIRYAMACTEGPVFRAEEIQWR